MKLTAVMLCCALGFLTGANPPDEAIKKDKAALQGNWKVQSFVMDGEAIPPEELDELPFFVVTGDQMQIRRVKVTGRGQ